jgi:hypothetical protein
MDVKGLTITKHSAVAELRATKDLTVSLSGKVDCANGLLAGLKDLKLDLGVSVVKKHGANTLAACVKRC